MAKSRNVNLNAILLIAAGALAGTQVFASKRKVEGAEGEKDKYVIDFKLADGTLVGDDVEVNEFVISDSASVAEFNRLFDNLPVVKGGYYSYSNISGPTNPQIYKTFDPQGIAKHMAQLIQAAHLIISRGGAEAQQMSDVLAAVFGYSELAAARIAEQKANSLADEIAKLNISPEKRREMLAKIGGGVPQATVETDEATGGDGDEKPRGGKRNKRERETADAEA